VKSPDQLSLGFFFEHSLLVGRSQVSHAGGLGLPWLRAALGTP